MNHTKAPLAPKIGADYHSKPAGTFYRFRAECEGDALLVRVALANWLIGWQERHDFSFIDVEVELELLDAAPDLPGILWVIEQLVDCHVAAETFELAQSYTGDRNCEPRLSVQPSEEQVLLVESALRRVPEIQKIFRERSKDAAVTFKAMRQPQARRSRDIAALTLNTRRGHSV